ncbi:MAG: hypothetical protein V4515_09875 [Chloroflexota bacterium]
MRIERECGAKQGYLSKAEAKSVARMMTRRHRQALHLYRCSFCRLFHVGHVVPAPLRAAVIPFPTRRAWRVEASW